MVTNTPPSQTMNRKQRRAAGKSVKFAPANTLDAAGLCRLGKLAVQTGKLEEAANRFRQATRIVPADANAHADLGRVYRDLGQVQDAIDSLTTALDLQPDNAVAHSALGTILQSQNRLDEAISHFRAARALAPNLQEATHHLALTYLNQGQADAAIPLLLDMLDQQAGLAEIWNDLGLAYDQLDQIEPAIAHYTTALRLRPDFAIAHFNLCRMLQRRGRLPEALVHASQAARLHPGVAVFHGQLGKIMFDLGRLAEAAASAREALRLDPRQPDGLELMGYVLHRVGMDAEAIGFYRSALVARPGNPGVLLNLGQMLQSCGQLDEAVATLIEAVRLDPAPLVGWLQLVQAKHHAADWRDLALFEQNARQRLDANPGTTPPFSVVLGMTSSAAEQRLAAERWCQKTFAQIETLPRQAPHAGDRIRIGYLSADYCAHATATLMQGVFESHDRSRFETFAYSIGRDDGSEYRRQSEAAFDHFTDLTQLSHEQAARRIQADQIDILVDLNGHARGGRTEILAYRPAPIQVNYLGYPGTMGASFIDYIMVDRVVAPPAAAPDFAEKLVYLPHCYQPNMRRAISQSADTRADHDLPDQGFVFCCFNQIYKIMPPVFASWMRLLRDVPHAVLWLLSETPSPIANLKREAMAQGIDPSRLIFGRKMTVSDHLARHRHADVFLDTLPVCAHTTASDALWAGLPLICCMGETFVSRVSGSLLMAMGLDDLITETPAAYEALALCLARDAEALASVRRRVWEARTASPLFNAALATRHIESAFSTMWQRHRDGAPPEHFAVDALA